MGVSLFCGGNFLPREETSGGERKLRAENWDLRSRARTFVREEKLPVESKEPPPESEGYFRSGSLTFQALLGTPHDF